MDDIYDLRNYVAIICYRYSPEELHAMVDLKLEKKEDE